MMKICHVTSMHPWNDDRIYERACYGLARRNIDVTLIATPGDDIYINQRNCSFKQGEMIDGVRCFWLKKRKGLRRRIFSSLEAVRKANALNCDIIHFHDPDLMPCFFLLRLLKRRKIVYDIHENYAERMDKLPFPKWVNRLFTALYRLFEYSHIKVFAGAVTVTDKMKSIYDRLSKPVCVVRNVPYVQRLPLHKLSGNKADDITIITSGTHTKSRNCMQSIEALPKVLALYPDVKMKFVGRYHPEGYENDLREKAREIGVSQNVIFEGMLPWIENFERISKAHIGCVLYEDNSNNRVVTPNRLFEYMIVRLAIIGENFPEVAKIINGKKCGVVVDSSNPESIADGLIRLLRDRENLVKLSENAYRAVKEKYNFENELTGMIRFYRRILNI